jgi:predicted PurR-regulated permease PerM
MSDQSHGSPDAEFDLIGKDVAPNRPDRRMRHDPIDAAPSWVMPVIRTTIWRLIIAVIVAIVLWVLLVRARGVVSMVVIAIFFGIAMDPGVTWLHQRRGWRRGAATGLIFLALAVFAVLMFFVLIPAIVTMASAISDQLPTWIARIQEALGISTDESANAEAAAQFEDTIRNWLQDFGGQLIGLASSTIGLIFNFFTIAMFTFYFAADAPRIRRAVLTRLSPQRQQDVGWAMDTAIIQTGGYFYSRALLMLINGGLFFFVMVAVGMPWELALPLSAFEGFLAEFIPAVGTYIGAAVPILITLGIQGWVPALILTGWAVVYQQIENYWLSPKLSAKTMELNGGVAFGSALAGGAMFGPMGAFMSLPAAALITSFMKNYGPTYELAYHSAYDDDEPSAPADAADPGS